MCNGFWAIRNARVFTQQKSVAGYFFRPPQTLQQRLRLVASYGALLSDRNDGGSVILAGSLSGKAWSAESKALRSVLRRAELISLTVVYTVRVYYQYHVIQES